MTQIDLAQRAQLTPESVCRFEKQRRLASIGGSRAARSGAGRACCATDR
jgi:hypothetical protein